MDLVDLRNRLEGMALECHTEQVRLARACEGGSKLDPEWYARLESIEVCCLAAQGVVEAMIEYDTWQPKEDV